MYFDTEAINEIDMESVARCVCGYMDGRSGQRGNGLIIKQRGNVVINCPEHNDHSPSCSIHNNRYYCFACGAKGDNISLVKHSLGVGFFEACKAIAAEFPEYDLVLSDDGAKEKMEFADFPLTTEDLFWLRLNSSKTQNPGNCWVPNVCGSCRYKSEIPEGMENLGDDGEGGYLYGTREKYFSLRDMWKTELKEFNGLVLRKLVEMMARAEEILKNNEFGKILSNPRDVYGCNDIIGVQKRRFEIMFNEFSGRDRAKKAGRDDLLKQISEFYFETVKALDEPHYCYKQRGIPKASEPLEPYSAYSDLPFIVK